MKCKPFASSAVKQRTLNEFSKHGIDQSRVELLPLLQSNVEHLKVHNMVDINLDTWPYAGTTTTCESLLMGVPVITLRGNCHSHNTGASILNELSLNDWVANSEEEYLRIAVEQAHNMENLKNLRLNLRNRLSKSNFCNCEEFTRQMELTYRGLWKTFISRNKMQ